MTCIDPQRAAEQRDTLQREDTPWREHLERCAACRAAEKGLPAVTAGADPVHPSGEALVLYEEHPDSLSSGARRYVAGHLEACATCREALEQVPAEEPPGARRRWVVGSVLGAAAVVLVAVVLNTGAPGGGGPASGEVHHAVVLTTSRGVAPAGIPAAATHIDFQPTLVTPVQPGDVIFLEVLLPDDTVALERRITVKTVDPDWGRPIIPLERSSLPMGNLRLRFTPGGGRPATFPFLHER